MFVSCTSGSVCFSHCSLWLVAEFLCQPGYVSGNPSGSRSEIRSKRPSWRSGSSSAVTLLTGQNVVDFPVLHSTDDSDCIPETPRISKQIDSLPGEPTRPQDKAYVWERIEAPLPPLRPWPNRNFIHPRQLSPFSARLELPFSNEEILSGYEEIVSSGTDHFTAWVKMTHHEVLVQHMVDIHTARAEFREASERKPATSSHMNSANKHFAIRSVVQKRTQHLQLER